MGKDVGKIWRRETASLLYSADGLGLPASKGAAQVLDAHIIDIDANIDQTDTARRFGDQWLHEARSAVLLAPSVIATLKWNALVNPLHPNAGRLIVSRPEKVLWDKRLFERRSS